MKISKKATTIAVINQKGGTGKTTTCENLGVGLAMEGKKVLLVDADPQGSLTVSMGWQNPDALPITLSTLMQKAMNDQCIPPGEGVLHHAEGVDLIPANIELAGLEVALVNTMSREKVMKQVLESAKREYDYILIDCTPSLGMLTVNALAAADSALIPMQAQYLSAKGLEQLLQTVQKVRRQINPKLKIEGILLTMTDSRTVYEQQISNLIRQAYGKHLKVFEQTIPRSVRAAELSTTGKSIFQYADSKNGEVFGHLMDIISAPSNIKLAFRNIKGNDGSHTAGTDGRTIESLAVMPEDKFVKLIQKQFRRYEPKAVRRVEIPKPNGKMRPLGIPCIIDRIVQQCILQVMEPICEAKFYEHSYGFRPCRSAENAISYAYGLAQRNKLHYVVDVDVKGFFDNVDHRKLLKQIWTLGIRDTKLIQIIKAMLKAPIEMPDGETVLPSKGTPQGGILSPLLANIVLNELDWWIASQWDEMVGHMKHPCKVTYYPNGAEKKCNSYTALKKSNLKEMRIVRYADDFKIFCRTKEDAEKTYYAVKDWLWKRLKLEVSDEKSKVTNLRKRDSEFLGFRIKLRRKSNSWVITSNVCDKAIHRISKEMADSVKAIQSSKTAEEISLNVGDYNAKVIGVQDYYCIATRINLNFSDIARPINGQLLHRIDGIKKQGEIKNRYLRKRYGKSKQMRWIGETPLVPLAYVQFKIPMRKSRKINPYTPEGRAEIHDNLRIDVNSMLWLMRHPIPTESVRYNDNRVSLYAGQDGKCAITGKKLDVQTCICYRKTNDCKKGNDSYQNLLLLSLQGLAIVSSEDMMSVVALVKEYSLNAKVITKVNKLRATAGLPLLAVK